MRKLALLFRFLLVAGAMFGVFFGVGSGVVNFLQDKTTVATADAGEQQTIQDGQRTNILVLGIDARSREKQSRSDTMMLVSIDPQLKKTAIISIPRDTRVDIPGSSLDKINAANYLGGPEEAVSVTEDLLGITIDNYVEVDFSGFKSIINTLGGVTMNVPQRMYKPSEDINLYPGVQHLNGYQALALVRYRGYVMGDIQREAEQQAFLKALVQEMLQPQTIAKIPQLVTEVNQYVDTDLTLKDMLKLASLAPDFKSGAVVAQTLPGHFYEERDQYGTLTQSYWEVDQDKLSGLLDNVLAGKTVDAIEDTTSGDESDQ